MYNTKPAVAELKASVYRINTALANETKMLSDKHDLDSIDITGTYMMLVTLLYRGSAENFILSAYSHVADSRPIPAQLRNDIADHITNHLDELKRQLMDVVYTHRKGQNHGHM